MRRWLIMLFAVIQIQPVFAHSLRLFAKVEGMTVSGYAFFIGGGRPDGVNWVAKAGDTILASGKTDASGGYVFSVEPPVTKVLSITVDTGEGHIATTTLAPERFGQGYPLPPTAAERTNIQSGKAENVGIPAEAVEATVERQIAPLLERIEEMDSRMRFTDIMSGIFLIIGLAGTGLWAYGRKR